MLIVPTGPQALLQAWFQTHKRDLPWRRTRDPYAVWVSEIMLQQTRVAAVLEHYTRWMAALPTVAALAAAPEPQVLALWSGLGYYRRARYLHRAAQVVVSQHHGAIPNTYAELLRLPGVGDYTAAAIASIAFGEAVPVVDGNVERVLTRVYGLTPPRSETPVLTLTSKEAAALTAAIRFAAAKLLDRSCPGDHNQAVMELGATVCLPRAPLCLHCPLFAHCQTRGEHATVARKPQTARTVAYTLAQRERGGATEVLLQQRPPDSSLMAGMWELPETPFVEGAIPLATLKHSITVTNYTVLVLPAPPGAAALARTRWVPVEDLPTTPLTGLARKALRRLSLWPATAETLLR